MAAAASLLLLGTVAFLYAGFPPQTKVEPPRTQLAAIPSPAAPAAAEVSGPAAERNISSLLRAPEAAAAPIAAATPTVEPTPAAERAAAPPVTQSPSAEASPPLTAAPSAVAATEGPAAVPDPVAPVTDAAINPVSPPAVEASRALIPSPAPPPGSTRNTASAPAGEGSRLAALPGPQTAPSSGPPRPPVGLPTPAAQGPARGQFVFVQRPDVNIRNRPSQAGQIVGMAQIGGRFVVAGREGEWVMVGQGPWRGWIHQRFLAPRLPR